MVALDGRKISKNLKWISDYNSEGPSGTAKCKKGGLSLSNLQKSKNKRRR